MSDVKVSPLASLIVEAIIDRSLEKINKNQSVDSIPQSQLLLYLCSVVLEHANDSLDDNKITGSERVALLVDIISILVSRLPLSDALKNVLMRFINDGEVEKLIEELDQQTTQKCRGCFGKLFRACVRSNN